MFPVGIKWIGHVDSETSLATPQAEFILKQTHFFSLPTYACHFLHKLQKFQFSIMKAHKHNCLSLKNSVRYSRCSL